MRALSIRQPYAELIPSASSGQALRGIKTVELRSRSTRIVGERFYIYASKGSGVRVQGSGKIWSYDLSARENPPAWMIELAEQVKLIERGALLPTGVIVRARALYPRPSCSRTRRRTASRSRGRAKAKSGSVGGQAVARGEGREARGVNISGLSCPQCPDIFIDGTTCAV
jgi:hypothetical protein